MRRLGAAAQLLHRPASAGDPVEVARAIAGAQAQDAYAGPLSFRSRSRRLTAADIERARTQERSLLRTWVMRKTIHLIPADDAGWMLPLFEPQIERWSRHRLAQLGLSTRAQERALGIVARALERDGPLTRTELAERVGSSGVELNTQTRLHLMLSAVVSGIAFLGPDRESSACLVRREDWLGELRALDREAALAELARRYLRAFGPAGERDFAYWSGLGVREVRTAMAAIAGEIEQARRGDEVLHWLRAAKRRLPPPRQIRMLGAFDTYLLGYRDRGFAVPSEHRAAVKEGGGGLIRPVIVRDGAVIGGWRTIRRSGWIELTLKLPDDQPRQVREAIETEIEDIARFEAMPVKLRGS